MSDDAAMEAPAQSCEHHFVSEHQPDMPVYWIRRCSLCGTYDAADLNAQIESAIADRGSAAPDDDVRAIGEIRGIHGTPLVVGVYRGYVNIDGRLLNRDQAEQFAVLFTAACWEAGRDQ
jgi:hypothetical protein